MYIERKLKRRKIKKILITIIPVLILIIGSSFAFFTFSKSREAFILTPKGISMQVEFKEGTNVINTIYAYPISDEFAKANLEKLEYVEFTVSGEISLEEYLYYELYLTEEDGNTLDPNYIKVYLTDDNNQEIVRPFIYKELPSSKSENKNGKILHSESLTGVFEKKFRIYVWIDSEYSQNIEHQTFAFKVNLYAKNTEKPVAAVEKIKNKINEENSITDDKGITYLSGTNEDINFNYVWYSGKLWRITAIYPDGKLKMIAEDAITGIYFGETSDFETSWVREWLNEDFKNTLYNSENIIDTNAEWKLVTAANGDTPYKIITTEVGLLNPYEFHRSIDKVNTDKLVEKFQKGYLNNGYDWWLSSSCDGSSDSTCIRAVKADGYNGDLWGGPPNLNSVGVRPAVVLKANVEFKNTGTKEDPFIITDDKEIGRVNDKLNERLSGEYVKIDNKTYRIVGIEENGATKLTSVDYVRDNNGILNKQYGSDSSKNDYNNVVIENNENYWGPYLNKTWLTPDLKKYLVPGTYYLGLTMIMDSSGAKGSSYKGTICHDINTKETTKKCEKTSRTWTGLVGLPRIGEMFAFPFGEDIQNVQNMFLITPYEGAGVYYSSGYLKDEHKISFSNYSDYYTVRPSITLNPEVIIIGGDGKSIKTAYEIELN